jgi:pyridoxamine 5'-phosphate oxidase
MDIADLRLSYTKGGLLESDVDQNPIAQFRTWFDQALKAEIPEANAMALATAADAVPNVRMVLLKGFDDRGFVFYTNYESRKSAELTKNPRAALLFYWIELERQVRVSGTVEKASEQESDSYFSTRPPGHQLGAWASNQSSVIANRHELEMRARAAEERFSGGIVPRPPHWGGYRVVPQVIEFWQGRTDRLHDRIEYIQTPDGWSIRRLSP